MLLKHGATQLDAAQAAEADALIDHLLAEAATLVEQNWPAIERVATALLDRRTLTQDDLDALIAESSATSLEGVQ